MKYDRQEINPVVFRDIIPDDVVMYMRPEMPSVEFKRKGVKYSMTDLRLLHPLGVEAFELCLNTMLNNPEIRECSIQCNDLDDNTIKIITDIVMGFQCTAKKGGKHGFFTGATPIYKTVCEKSENGNPIKMAFHITDSFARCVYKYRQSCKDTPINLCDIVASVCDHIWDDTDGKLCP